MFCRSIGVWVKIEKNLNIGRTLVSWIPGPQMPRSLSHHCSVKLSNEEFLLIGGEQLESEYGKKQRVYKGQIGAENWTELPNLKVPRKGHSCGKFTLRNGTQVVIVAGGETGSKMASDVRLIGEVTH